MSPLRLRLLRCCLRMSLRLRSISIGFINSVIKMKRTRETIFFSHPDQRWNLSGATTFDGEDLGEEERRRHNQALQRQYYLE